MKTSSIAVETSRSISQSDSIVRQTNKRSFLKLIVVVVETGSSNLQKGPNLGRKIVVVITRRSYKRGGRKAGMFHCLYSKAGSNNYLYNEGWTIKTLWGKWKKSCNEKLVIGHSLCFSGNSDGSREKKEKEFCSTA